MKFGVSTPEVDSWYLSTLCRSDLRSSYALEVKFGVRLQCTGEIWNRLRSRGENWDLSTLCRAILRVSLRFTRENWGQSTLFKGNLGCVYNVQVKFGSVCALQGKFATVYALEVKTGIWQRNARQYLGFV